MDLDVMGTILERAVASLGLDAPLHPWWLGETRPRRPARLGRFLASPCPLEVRLLEAFLPEDREGVARQIEDGYEHLVVRAGDTEEPVVDEASVVHVQLGVPLIGRDRVLVRVCTRNLYADAQTVTTDYHAWLTADGALAPVLDRGQQELASEWPRWVVGQSPGLRGDGNSPSG